MPLCITRYRKTRLYKMIFGLATAAAAAVSFSSTATACPEAPYLGSICVVPYDSCPEGWASADGSTMIIRDNESLYSVMGTSFGGDGRTTFMLPDMRGRVAIHQEQAVGQLSVGATGGTEQVTPAIVSVGSNPSSSTTAEVVVGNQSFDNRARYFGMRFCVAVVGDFPPRP